MELSLLAILRNQNRQYLKEMLTMGRLEVSTSIIALQTTLAERVGTEGECFKIGPQQ